MGAVGGSGSMLLVGKSQGTSSSILDEPGSSTAYTVIFGYLGAVMSCNGRSDRMTSLMGPWRGGRVVRDNQRFINL